MRVDEIQKQAHDETTVTELAPRLIGPLTLHPCCSLYSNLATDAHAATSASFGGMELWIPKVERYLAAGYGTEDLSEMLGRLQPTMLDVLSPIDTRDKSEWRDLVDRCDRIAQVAQQIGCPSIQVVVLDNMGGMSLRQQRCFVAGRLKELADVTSSYGVVLAIEPVAFSPLRSLNDISELIEDVGLDKLKMVLDTWHLWAGGESWERVAEVDSSLIVTAHIGDSAPKCGSSWSDVDRSILPGDGILPLREAISAIGSTGFTGPWAVEVISAQYREWESVALARELNQRARYLLKEAGMEVGDAV
ncbi:sugar phosphate isomerase/epimerase family protein [Actinomyces sp. oral taxon 849]|uniref:sugar phosphate isomerase/epimerase family protein n=1 Tax=Actinomyces sp. oral taxon 849 TaxID=653385 RepID=UPI0018DC9F85|nr:sugar phosphate isomerase/epimerase family protein [Actinomyces sp. oral taxon 849]